MKSNSQSGKRDLAKFCLISFLPPSLPSCLPHTFPPSLFPSPPPFLSLSPGKKDGRRETEIEGKGERLRKQKTDEIKNLKALSQGEKEDRVIECQV